MFFQFREQVYEKVWIIPDWLRVQQTEDSLTAQTFHFETGKSWRVKTKWEIGFRNSKKFAVYWELIEVKGFPEGAIRTRVSTAVSQANSTFVDYGDTEVKTFDLGEALLTPHSLSFEKTAYYWSKFVDANGELKIKLKLTLLEPETHADIDTKMEEFRRTSVDKFCANFATLLNDKSTADLKIVASDGKELWAHKLILKGNTLT